MTEAVVKNATEGDLEAIARCHREAFPGSLSSAMGISYLVRMLGWYLYNEKAFLFFLESNGQCVGYCGGLLVDGKALTGSASGMAQYSFNQAVVALALRPWLFVHREFLNKYLFVLRNIVMRIRSFFGIKPVRKDVNQEDPYVGLVVIGVSRKFQSLGLGSRLLAGFDEIVRSKGYQLMRLTVLTSNQQAIRSYLRNGWSVTESGPKSTTMEKRLD